jgi:cytochrome c
MNMSSAAVKCLIYIATACASAQTSAIGANLATAASNSAADVEDAGRARALLQRAIAHYNNISDPSFADFTSKSKFVDDELYVYVVSTAGVLLASGGPSASLIGQNVSEQRDALGKPFAREMLLKARTSTAGEVEYRWLNPKDNKVELKIAHFQKVGDRIIVVGHYVARSTPEEAQAFVASSSSASTIIESAPTGRIPA